MGQLFQQGGLTNPGTALESSANGGEPIFIGTPSQVQQHLGQARDAVIKSGINNPVMAPKPQPAFPTVGQPSYQQAASAGATPGGANALSPGLSKAGKLVTLLTSGLQGALAGRAKSEETVAATGGRRAGGAGMGFEAGYMLPWQRAGAAQQLAQQQAQTGVLQSEAQNYNIPGVGPLPGWLAKAMGPAYLRQQGQLGAAQTRADSAESIAGENIASREKIAQMSQGSPLPVDETVANMIGRPDLAGKPVGKADWDLINKALTAKGYKTQDLGQEGLWLLDRAGNRIKRIGDSPGVGRANEFARARAEYTPFETVQPGTNIPGTISNLQAIRTGAPKIPIAQQTKLGGQYAVFNDAYGLLNRVEQDAAKVNLQDPAVRTRLAAGYASLSEPASKGLVGQFAGILGRSTAGSALKPEERQLLIHMGQLKAASLGLRTITGQAGANEFQQRTDAALAAGPQQAVSVAALRQHTQGLRDFLRRFEVGIPQVGLNAPNQPSNLGNVGGQQAPNPFAQFGGVPRP